MKVLVVSEIGCAPPWHGNRVRLRSFLRELKRLGHEIHFAGVCMSDAEVNSTIPYIDKWVWNFSHTQRHSSLATILESIKCCPSKLSRMFYKRWRLGLDRGVHPGWLSQVRALQRRENYGAVIVQYVFHSAFLECFPDPCIRIIDTHDIFANRNSVLQNNGITALWFSTTPSAEKMGLQRAAKVIAIQAKEAEYFQQLLGGTRSVVTIGHILDAQHVLWPTGETFKVGYFASNNSLNCKSFDWFVTQVWNQFVENNPSSVLFVGGGISARVKEHLGVRVIGEVDNARDFYSLIHVTVNPMLFGTGLKIKTIESLAHGRPSVASSVACEGIENYVGRGIYLANTAEQYSTALMRLSGNVSEVEQSGRLALSEIEAQNEIFRSHLRQLFQSKG